jgi:ABC-type Na+ efflux pump permease subunit
MAVFRHEIRLLRRNPIMWFRFAIFYLVISAVIVTDVVQMRDDRLSLEGIALMILAAVGIATALASESFVQEKERRTMEALLLIPTSAASIARIKSIFVVAAAMTGVAIAFLTGPGAVSLLGDPDQYQHFFNRSMYVTAIVACPPATINVAALGTFISSRSQGFQTATTTAPLLGMIMIIPVLTIAYVLSESSTVVSVAVGTAWWVVALGGWRLALSTVRPETMIKTRGR